jgi:hypothetical protein
MLLQVGQPHSLVLVEYSRGRWNNLGRGVDMRRGWAHMVIIPSVQPRSSGDTPSLSSSLPSISVMNVHTFDDSPLPVLFSVMNPVDHIFTFDPRAKDKHVRLFVLVSTSKKDRDGT